MIATICRVTQTVLEPQREKEQEQICHIFVQTSFDNLPKCSSKKPNEIPLSQTIQTCQSRRWEKAILILDRAAAAVHSLISLHTSRVCVCGWNVRRIHATMQLSRNTLPFPPPLVPAVVAAAK
jgi:hypothetical protein